MAKYRILLADSNNQFQTTVRELLRSSTRLSSPPTVNS